MTGNFLVGIAVAVVAMVLLAGLYTLWAGGEVSRNWSNRLMRIRVLAQFIAVLIILAVLYFSGRY
jgi:drug/metabolite transporter (DMT)-like permease